MSDAPSKAAMELAEALFPDFTPQIHVGYADIIQSHLADLLEKATIVHGWIADDTVGCHDAHDALGKSLEPWKAGE